MLRLTFSHNERDKAAQKGENDSHQHCPRPTGEHLDELVVGAPLESHRQIHCQFPRSGVKCDSVSICGVKMSTLYTQLCTFRCRRRLRQRQANALIRLLRPCDDVSGGMRLSQMYDGDKLAHLAVLVRVMGQGKIDHSSLVPCGLAVMCLSLAHVG